MLVKQCVLGGGGVKETDHIWCNYIVHKNHRRPHKASPVDHQENRVQLTAGKTTDVSSQQIWRSLSLHSLSHVLPSPHLIRMHCALPTKLTKLNMQWLFTLKYTSSLYHTTIDHSQSPSPYVQLSLSQLVFPKCKSAFPPPLNVPSVQVGLSDNACSTRRYIYPWRSATFLQNKCLTFKISSSVWLRR